LFLSYLGVAAVGVTALFLTTRFLGPELFDDEVRQLGQRFGWSAAGSPGRGQGAGGGTAIEAALNDAFSSSLTLALIVALIAATVAALIVGAIIGGRLLRPLDQIRGAVRRMASGHYDEQIPRTDDTELAELASDVNALGASLRESEQRRSRVISDVAHELRTPITSLDGYLEGIEDGIFDASPATVTAMREETRRLQRLAGDLSALSRAEEQAFDLRPEAADLGQVATAAARALAGRFADAEVTLEIPHFRELPGHFDRDRLGQVFTNLLRNALEHTPAGGSVSLHGEKRDTDLIITVADTGTGIAAEHLPHVFERFYRAGSADRAGGTGIGLTIARSIVRAHGGDLTGASPGPGAGAAFTVRIPEA
jgi:histidine kinase